LSELILSDKDLIAEDHWPVECALGFYSERSKEEHEEFPVLVEAISRGEGYNDDEHGCIFWDELDEYDKAHESRFDVECYATEKVCRLTYKKFYGYLEIACERYSRRYPSARELLEGSLAAYRKRFL
jgi:hypothetical protein